MICVFVITHLTCCICRCFHYIRVNKTAPYDARIYHTDPLCSHGCILSDYPPFSILLASGERGNCYRNFRYSPWKYVKLLYLLCFHIYKPHPIGHHRIPLNSALNVVSNKTQNFPGTHHRNTRVPPEALA